jgi:hypothetical protein
MNGLTASLSIREQVRGQRHAEISLWTKRIAGRGAEGVPYSCAHNSSLMSDKDERPGTRKRTSTGECVDGAKGCNNRGECNEDFRLHLLPLAIEYEVDSAGRIKKL